VLRFFLPADCWTADAALSGEEAKHCAQVLRAAPGDVVEVFDGAGRRARATVASVTRQRVGLRLEDPERVAPLVPRITLYQAVPKGKTMDLIVQKAVEFGVAAIQPVLTSHTVVRLEPGEAQRKAEKWQRVALEACKQCGQDSVPVVHPPMSLAEALTGTVAGDLRVIASLAPGAVPLRDRLRGTAPATADVLVGPEGDFTRAETEAAIAAGFSPVTLGRIVLRAETATFFVLGALRYEFSDA
jgi:16S rRNA (uracil1498-N3)-methyltransferase